MYFPVDKKYCTMYLGIAEPVLPRKRKVPARLEDFGPGAAAHVDQTPADRFRREYFAAVDNSVATVKDRFQQEGTVLYSSLVTIIKNAINGDSQEIPDNVTKLYSEVDWTALEPELSIVTSLVQQHSKEIKSMDQFACWLKSCHSRPLLKQVEILTSLILVLPATNAVSERSFSTLKRLKTYLRATMGQERLNSCMLLLTYRELTDSLETDSVISEFVSGHTDRAKRIAVKNC
jgi:hypothetical protein